jgi:protein-S-isoprenylcysteine O-methyltransferase Ste14
MISSALALVIYFIFFAVVHSILADPRFKEKARRSMGTSFDRWSRLGFIMLALLMVLPFFYFVIAVPSKVLYIIPFPWSWLMTAGRILALLALLLALRQTGVSYFLGFAQLQEIEKTKKSHLVTNGFYCHLRNPLFFFGALFLWLSPTMTVNLLIFNILATVYFYVGARHEERSLRLEFGNEYEEYRRSVPMFIPRMNC